MVYVSLLVNLVKEGVKSGQCQSISCYAVLCADAEEEQERIESQRMIVKTASTLAG